MENEIIMNETPVQQQEPITNPQAPVTQQQPKEVEETIRFWEFLAMIILFAIPVIGLISMIVFMFSPKRESIKNYARAMLVWLAVRVVAIVLIISLIITAIGGMLLPIINETFGMEFDSIQQAFSLMIDISNENYSGVLKQLQPQLSQMLGEKYAGLLEELSGDEYNNLLQQIVKRDYTTILGDLEANKYPNLSASIGDEEYAKLIKEVQAASNGEPSELLDQINNLIPSF